MHLIWTVCGGPCVVDLMWQALCGRPYLVDLVGQTLYGRPCVMDLYVADLVWWTWWPTW